MSPSTRCVKVLQNLKQRPVLSIRELQWATSSSKGSAWCLLLRMAAPEPAVMGHIMSLSSFWCGLAPRQCCLFVVPAAGQSKGIGEEKAAFPTVPNARFCTARNALSQSWGSLYLVHSAVLNDHCGINYAHLAKKIKQFRLSREMLFAVLMAAVSHQCCWLHVRRVKPDLLVMMS